MMAASSEDESPMTAADASLQAILDDAAAGRRINAAEGVRLLESRALAAIGRAADAVTRRLHPEPYRTYNIDRNVNYTNICTAVCDFCAFYRGPRARRATSSIGTCSSRKSRRRSRSAATRS